MEGFFKPLSVLKPVCETVNDCLCVTASAGACLQRRVRALFIRLLAHARICNPHCTVCARTSPLLHF